MALSTKHILCLLCGAATLAGCCLIDEDLTECETDYEIRYEIRLVTNRNAELETRLGTPADAPAAAALRAGLEDVFSDYAHDLDLRFYDVIRDEAAGDSLRRHHGRHNLDGSEGVFTFFLPVREYMHLAAANVEGNGAVQLEEAAGRCHTARLVQAVRDTVPSHRNALFTARLPMNNIRGDESQRFDASLYMANCASALVVDTLNSHIRKLDVYAMGFATGFNLCDSSYVFSYTPYMKPERLDIPGTGNVGYLTVHFPSRDFRSGTRSVEETEAPFLAESAPDPLWRYLVYATLPDGTITATRLNVYQPIRAGQLRIIKVKLKGDGSGESDDATVGVSVTLDWSPGMDIDIEL